MLENSPPKVNLPFAYAVGYGAVLVSAIDFFCPSEHLHMLGRSSHYVPNGSGRGSLFMFIDENERAHSDVVKASVALWETA